MEHIIYAFIFQLITHKLFHQLHTFEITISHLLGMILQIHRLNCRDRLRLMPFQYAVGRIYTNNKKDSNQIGKLTQKNGKETKNKNQKRSNACECLWRMQFFNWWPLFWLLERFCFVLLWFGFFLDLPTINIFPQYLSLGTMKQRFFAIGVMHFGIEYSFLSCRRKIILLNTYDVFQHNFVCMRVYVLYICVWQHQSFAVRMQIWWDWFNYLNWKMWFLFGNL